MSANPPAPSVNVLSLIIQYAVTDGPALVALVQTVEGAIASIPPAASRTIGDYMKVAGTILTSAAPLADAIEHQIKGQPAA